MHSHEKEHLLHKILAGSAFAVALSLLPIIHYLRAIPLEGGTVAGASTDTSITSESCIASRQQQLDDLDRWLKGKQTADLAEYTDASLGVSSDSEAGRILYDTYTQKLARESSTVASQKEGVASAACPLP